VLEEMIDTGCQRHRGFAHRSRHSSVARRSSKESAPWRWPSCAGGRTRPHRARCTA